MEIPIDGAQRSEWNTDNREEFFSKIQSLFKTLRRNDTIEIKERLHTDEPDYFELPIYDKKSDQEPVVIVIFVDDKVFIDFIDPEKKQKYLKKIQNLAGQSTQPIHWRDLTQKDWEKRLAVLESLSEF